MSHNPVRTQSETKSLIGIIIPEDITTDRTVLSSLNVLTLRADLCTAAAILAGVFTDLADAAADLDSGDFHAVHILVPKSQQIGVLSNLAGNLHGLLLRIRVQFECLFGQCGQCYFKFFHLEPLCYRL